MTPITDGELALILVLGTMLELGRSRTLTATQLDAVMSPALDALGTQPERKKARDRLRSFQRGWRQARG